MRILKAGWQAVAVTAMLGIAAVAWGARPNFAFLLLLLVIFSLLQLMKLGSDRARRERWRQSVDVLPLLFFISGFAALVYQVVWQRVLFAVFGINSESVTVIVSVFMLGLGVGALAGGYAGKRWPGRQIQLFVLIELLIGAFGIFSIPLIHWAGEAVTNPTLPALVAVTYALLAVPTLLMGATLPLLVGFMQRHFSNLGKSVGRLYALNTFGSALAAFLTVELLFVVTGRQGAVYIAAFCNLATAVLVYAWSRDVRAGAKVSAKKSAVAWRISLPRALLIAAAIGFVSLSLEILWYRALGVMTATRPQTFGLMLAFYLCGIALSALRVEKLSAGGGDLRGYVFKSLAALLAASFLALPLVAGLTALAGQAVGVSFGFLVAGLLAFLSGGIFPALCQAAGRVTPVYFCNIIGAALGPLVTGFILLDRLTLEQASALMATTVLVPLLLLEGTRMRMLGITVLAVVAGYLSYPVLYAQIPEKLLTAREPFRYVVQNRGGIIAVMADPEGGDIVLGSGAYDGRISTDPVRDSNMITRAYMLAALHPAPGRVLEVGLATGAWAKVMTEYVPLRELVSVEINKGYPEVISRYPEVAGLLEHSKFRLVVDDGRRWLRRNPDEKFDVILMNASIYWRDNSTNVLSKEFLELCKAHLNPGGIVYYNTTGSAESVYTAAEVFRHVVVFNKMVAAGDAPFAMTPGQKRENLLRFADETGRSVLDAHDAKRAAVLEKLAVYPQKDLGEELRGRDDLMLITDDSMVPEFKSGGQSFLPRTTWRAPWE